MLFDQFTKMYAIVFIALCASFPSILAERPRLLSDLFPQDGLCGLSTQDRLAALAHIKEAADLLSAGAESTPVKVEDCGEGLWRQVADLDVTRGDTTCPGEWEFATSPRTGCTKPDNNVGGCSVATFSTSNTLDYSRVCGRITGRSEDFPNGFRRIDAFTANTEVDGVTLVDGVTITHDSPIRHIWTFAANFEPTVFEVGCPCNTGFTRPMNTLAVDFAQGNYFCDYSRANEASPNGDRQLWTDDCAEIFDNVPACCNFGNPPYFSMTLTPTTDDIDVWICTDRNSVESVFVESMELYVQ